MLAKEVTCPQCQKSVLVQIDANCKIHQDVAAICPKCGNEIVLTVTVVIVHKENK